ncbi:RHS repeat-associated core domain-containing protein [uncultured Paracoccus sp.]|uniref:RHS repeat-associated core domain-containing protein n=2 Tax=uncultured Paracoccus sp. TaxID=189685 RepID=UPI00262877EB|nr:RHS repeat-associated core domain-containing protein [uncultured Paracoccus sp.]
MSVLNGIRFGGSASAGGGRGPAPPTPGKHRAPDGSPRSTTSWNYVGKHRRETEEPDGASGGFDGGDGWQDNAPPPGFSGNERYEQLRQQYALSDGDRAWDQALAVAESQGVQNALLTAGVLGPGALAGGTALAGGATLGGASLAALAASLPVAIAAIGGFAAYKIMSPVGDKVGHWFMQTDFMKAKGFVPIAGPGEKPARLLHPIAHANTGFSLGGMLASVVVGALVGIAVGALVVGTGGAALVVGAIAGGAVAGLIGGFSEAVGQYGKVKGKIIQGSPDVYFENQPVARVGDKIQCDDHADAAVSEGAERVFANGMPIARIGHKTTCDGTINEGLETIAIDIDTSALSLERDVGTLNRLFRTGALLADVAPLPRGKTRDGTPSTARGGDAPNSCRTTCKDPIDVATGQFVDLRTDIFIPGTIPLRLDRCHARESRGIQGEGWSGTWAQHLRIEGETITFQNPEGCLIVFHAPADEVLSHNLRFPHLELIGRRSGDLFVYDRPAQLFYVFADEGGGIRCLSRIEDRNGNRISLTYGPDGLRRVEHSDGFALQVHSLGGLIRKAVLDAPDGGDCVFQWDYTADGRLREVRSSQTGYMRYDHDGDGRITGWHDAKDSHVHYEYGSNGRIIRTWTDSGHMGGQIDYDLARQRTQVRDSEGVVSYDWDTDGLVWREIDALGHVWLTDWDKAFHITTRTDPLRNKTEFAFDSLGNLIRSTDADGNVTAWDYGRDGLLSAMTDPAGNRSEYRHDQNGNLVGTTDPLGRITTLGLGEQGQVLRVDLPGGVQERIYYDPLIRPSRRRDPDGNETRMGYDTEGRLVWFTDAIGATTRYDLGRGPDNPRGAIRRVETPDGAVSTVTWDIEGQLSSITNPVGDTRHFRFGAFDLPLESVDAQGHRLRLEHDRETRLSAVINELGERHDYQRDAAGRVVAERDYSGLVTRYDRDAAGRVIGKTAPDGARTHYDYSPAGRLLQMRVQSGAGEAVTRFAYDPRGLMTRAENAAATVEYDYDALGRVVAERLNGREITSDYSLAGQRIARSGDVLHLTAGWSRAGLPTVLGIGDHAPLTFRHDPRGLEQLRSSEQGFALAQGHSLMGNLAEQIAGPLTRLPEEARTGALGSERPLDFATRVGAGLHRSFDWDRAGRAVAIHDRQMGWQAFGYDDRGQVAAARRDGPDGQSLLTEYEYDPARNIAAVIEAGHRQPVRTAAGRVQRRGGRVSYRHDDCGRVIEKRVEEPGFRPRIWRMAWNGEGQMVALETPEETVWHYAYDPLGRRIARKAANGPGHAYQWEGDRLIAEAPMTADGAVAWDQARHWVYEPDDFRPLAQIDGDALHYVVTDHLGTPREMFSEDGSEVAWRAELSLWGEMAELRRKAANDDAPPLDCPIRFQGQWHDPESGLHYNRFRYYDPEATQYLSPDPIGMAGGVRPQGYVDSPVELIDPYGLKPCSTADGSVRFKRWSRGDAIDKPLPDGSSPSWDVVRSRYWKNRAHLADSGEFSSANLRRMRRGSAPLDYNPRTRAWESRELHHVIPQQYGGGHTPLNLRELTPDWHGEVDPFRHTRPTIRGIR